MERCSLVQGWRALCALLLAACFVSSASAHATRAGRQAQLRASSPAVPPAAADAAEAAAADAKRRRAIVAAFRAVAGVESEGEQQQRGDGEEESERPVSMQVPEQELKEFIGQLSPRCKSQFSDILGGKSDLHTFGEGGARSNETCTEMKGGLCSMNAQVTQQQEGSGRKLKSVTEVSGKSCLPQDCMAEDDLKVLASFMKLKARDSMGGSHNLDIDIDLYVDCTASGGSSAGALGELSKEAPAEGKQPTENTVENNSVRPAPMRSAAPTRAALGTTVVATLVASAAVAA